MTSPPQLVEGPTSAPLEGPEGVLEPTGRTIEWRFCAIWRLAARGKLVEAEAYYDLSTQLGQVGSAA